MMETTRVAGTVAPGLEPVRDAFALGHEDDPGAAQLCAYRDGEPIVDLWTVRESDRGAFSGDSLSVIWSSTKGALALCAAILVDRGLLDVDAPVARYWPEFAVNGKEHTTTAHFLTHTSGLPGFPSWSGIRAADYGDRDRCIRALEQATPLWEPGTTRGLYHGMTYGFLVSEVMRRITGITEGEFFADEIAGPLGLRFWIGLPPELEGEVWPRAMWREAPAAPAADTWSSLGVDVDDPLVVEYLAGERLGSDAFDYFNSPEGHAAQVPAANGIATARSIARMYAAAVGEVDGVRLLSPEVVDFVREPRLRGRPVLRPLALPGSAGGDRGLGFWLSDPPGAEFDGAPIPGTFGHPGAGGVHGFAHPGRKLAVGYTCTSMYAGGTRDPRLGWADAINDLVPDPA
jgi:CubicO group peptidase (beta-lactamase class C family)